MKANTPSGSMQEIPRLTQTQNCVLCRAGCARFCRKDRPGKLTTRHAFTSPAMVRISLAAVGGDGQHAERHVPDSIRVRGEVFSLPLLPTPRAAKVRAVDGLQLVHVVILGALRGVGEAGQADGRWWWGRGSSCEERSDDRSTRCAAWGASLETNPGACRRVGLSRVYPL